MAENVVHKFPDILDEDMNKELYLIAEEEIQEETFNTIKENYGTFGPDFQIIEKNGGFYLKGDMDIEAVEEAVNVALASKGVEAVFPEGEEPEPEPEPDEDEEEGGDTQ